MTGKQKQKQATLKQNAKILYNSPQHMELCK